MGITFWFNSWYTTGMSIEESLLRGGVWYNIWDDSTGTNKSSSLSFINSFFTALRNHNIDYNPQLPEAILAREKRQSTNLGNGIAIPHPDFDGLNEPAESPITRDTIYLAYPRFSLLWDDGTSVFAVFFICMTSKEKHLAALSDLAKGLSKPGVMDLLQAREPLEPLLTVFRAKKSND